jgi:polyisoprenoid-binding protein YceI
MFGRGVLRSLYVTLTLIHNTHIPRYDMENRTTWVIDPAHSEITFKVKHLMIANVKGEFRRFDATLDTIGDDFSKGRISATIDAASIFTNNDDRDAHLRSADFFDADNHGEIRFEGTEFTQLDDENFRLKGLLSMRGVEREVALEGEFGGFMQDPYGNEKAGFSLSAKINRKDWGLNWNTALETGGVLVSEDVRIAADMQFVKKAA